MKFHHMISLLQTNYTTVKVQYLTAFESVIKELNS